MVTRPIEEVVPYLATAAWYAHWLSRYRLSGDDTASTAYANRQTQTAGKEFARCSLASSHAGDEQMLLSVAVEGGASRLKRRGAERNAKLSMHGNWPHQHLGAIDALYGRTPYYQHIVPELRGVLGNLPESLAELNKRIHGIVKELIALSPCGEPIPPVVMARTREVARQICPDLSILDALMRLGSETSLGLMSLGTRIDEPPQNLS